MKPKLTIGLSIIISLVLVVFGLVYGNVSGYADERAHVTALLDGDSGLRTVVGYRAADGMNLLVVANRHIATDTDTAALRTAAQALRDGEPSISALKAGDDTLTRTFAAVVAKLKGSGSFQASERDGQYLDMITSDFDQFGRHAIYTTYNKAAEEFNQRLATPVLGDIARFFGVRACELFA